MPFWSMSLQPHTLLWLLKSPIIMNGFGSCANRCSKSAILKRSPGGKYKEHT